MGMNVWIAFYATREKGGGSNTKIEKVQEHINAPWETCVGGAGSVMESHHNPKLLSRTFFPAQRKTAIALGGCNPNRGGHAALRAKP